MIGTTNAFGFSLILKQIQIKDDRESDGNTWLAMAPTSLRCIHSGSRGRASPGCHVDVDHFYFDDFDDDDNLSSGRSGSFQSRSNQPFSLSQSHQFHLYHDADDRDQESFRLHKEFEKEHIDDV